MSENLPVREPVQEPVLVMDAALMSMLYEYLENKPYSVVKPIMDSITASEKDVSGTMQAVYVIPRKMALHLLDSVMANENMVKTYMFIRQGYERSIASEKQSSSKEMQIKEIPNITSKKDKQIAEIPIDNITK